MGRPRQTSAKFPAKLHEPEKSCNSGSRSESCSGLRFTSMTAAATTSKGEHELVCFEDVLKVVKEARLREVSEQDLLRLNDKELLVLGGVLTDRKIAKLTDININPRKWSPNDANRWFTAAFQKFQTARKYRSIAAMATNSLLTQVLQMCLSVTLLTYSAADLGRLFKNHDLGAAIYQEISDWNSVANGFRKDNTTDLIPEDRKMNSNSNVEYFPTFPTFMTPDHLPGTTSSHTSLQQFQTVRDLQLALLRNRSEYPEDVARVVQMQSAIPSSLIDLDQEKTKPANLKAMMRELGPGVTQDLVKLMKKRKTTENLRKRKSGQKEGIKKPRGKRELLLWQFILNELLIQQQSNKYIYWLDKTKGSFEISDSIILARRWGQTKENDKMTYEKMSRSMRQYYREDKSGIIQKTDESRRLVYRFNWRHKCMQGHLNSLKQSHPELATDITALQEQLS